MYFNGQLASLDVSHNTALQFLTCRNSQLTSLDVSGCTALQSLDCRDNQLTSLNLGNNTKMTSLICNNNQLTWLDVTGCTDLRSLDCSYNPLFSLDGLSQCLTEWDDLYPRSNPEDYPGLPKKLVPYKATKPGTGTVYYFYINEDTKGDHQSLADLIHAAQGGNYFDPAKIYIYTETNAGTDANIIVVGSDHNFFMYLYTFGGQWGSDNIIHLSAGIDFDNAIQDSENPFVKAVQSVDIASISLPKGITSEIGLSVLPADATNKDIVWASSDDSIVSVDQNGVVTTNATGTATITATAADESAASAAIVVNVTEAQTDFDLNHDGQVTVADVTLIYQKILGLI